MTSALAGFQAPQMARRRWRSTAATSYQTPQPAATAATEGAFHSGWAVCAAGTTRQW